MPRLPRISLVFLILLTSLLQGCFSPPFNNFKPDLRPLGLGTFSPKSRELTLIKILRREGIEYIRYGDQRVLMIPTDTYYMFDNYHLNDIRFRGLNNVVALLKTQLYTTIYVAAFTDDVGSKSHKYKLSEARAEEMVGFLWAHNIKSKLLKPEGYGDQHPIGDNKYIHSSAFNRRIEIQWTTRPYLIDHATKVERVKQAYMTK